MFKVHSVFIEPLCAVRWHDVGCTYCCSQPPSPAAAARLTSLSLKSEADGKHHKMLCVRICEASGCLSVCRIRCGISCSRDVLMLILDLLSDLALLQVVKLKIVCLNVYSENMTFKCKRSAF